MLETTTANGDLALGPFQTVVLAALIGFDRQCTLKQLHERLQADQQDPLAISIVYRTVSRLEERGLVECSFDQTPQGRPGRPRKLVKITPGGKDKVAELRHVLETVTALMADDSKDTLPPDKQATWEPGAFRHDT